ncbi:hypothetical protein NP493_698g01020 [Ridgeia piscesae]|uniref:EF-hand domain-containing protein n=1 Tax=Ridgeia piscesae TaxID=27915 RepID=A0AAD9KR15_RIDPI|nr:hypothetical protein NP493_698g01020 [Ridgeia piscesae]
MSPLSGFVLVVLLVAASCLSVQDSRRRTIRGFRVGAADRFSHGFGKRAEPLEDALAQRLGYPRISVGELARVLSRDVRIGYDFIKKYIDKNGDGYISDDELTPATTLY